MKKIILFLGIIFLATLGLIWPKHLRFFYCQPDLLLIFMVALVFYTDFKTAWLFGILAGLVKDLFLPGTFAINAICFGLWGYALQRLNRQISTDEPSVRLVIVLIVALLNNLVLGLQSISAGNIIPAGIFLRNLIIVSVYTTVLAPLIFRLTKKITLAF